jgi:hypothetical protein
MFKLKRKREDPQTQSIRKSSIFDVYETESFVTAKLKISHASKFNEFWQCLGCLKIFDFQPQKTKFFACRKFYEFSSIKPHFKRFFLSKPRNILIHAFNIFWQLKHLSLYYQHLSRFSIKPERCIHSHSIFQFSVSYCTWIRMFNVFGLLPVFLNVLFATLSYVIWFEVDV